MSNNRENLLQAAKGFCEAFAAQNPLDDILAHFAAKDSVCFEHGLQVLAPYIGRSFNGLDGAREYFSSIASLLSYENMLFSDYFADVVTRQVSVKGRAKFTWKSTGNGWNEVFTYRLEFDEQLKVKVYEVWGDGGAAYLAENITMEPARDMVQQ